MASMTDTPQNIHQAIHAVKSALALHGIGKDRKNADQKYSFRGVEDVINALSELFVTHRINVVPRIVQVRSVERQTGNGKPMPASFVDAEFDLVSVDDGSLVTFKAPGEGADMSDKGTNKAMSAAFKYAMTLGFVIPTQGVLDEGDATTPGTEREQQREPERPQDKPQQTPSDWAHRQISFFESCKDVADRDKLRGRSDDPRFQTLMDRFKIDNGDLWRSVVAAESAAMARCDDDTPF